MGGGGASPAAVAVAGAAVVAAAAGDASSAAGAGTAAAEVGAAAISLVEAGAIRQPGHERVPRAASCWRRRGGGRGRLDGRDVRLTAAWAADDDRLHRFFWYELIRAAPRELLLSCSRWWRPGHLPTPAPVARWVELPSLPPPKLPLQFPSVGGVAEEPPRRLRVAVSAAAAAAGAGGGGSAAADTRLAG